MEHKNLAVELLTRLLKDEVKAKSRTNIVQSRKLSEMLEESLRRYQNQVRRCLMYPTQTRTRYTISKFLFKRQREDYFVKADNNLSIHINSRIPELLKWRGADLNH